MKKFELSIGDMNYLKFITEDKLNWISETVYAQIFGVSEKQFMDFAQDIGTNGFAFCPATFRREEFSRYSFKQTQLLVLCFDSSQEPNPEKQVTFDTIKDRIKKYDLPLLFAWDLFSNECYDKNIIKRFSMAFLMETPFTDYRETETAIKALKLIFPEAKKYESYSTQIYQGGNRLLYVDPSMPAFDVEQLFMQVCLYLKDKYGLTNYKRKMVEFSDATGIALNSRKLPYITVVQNHSDMSIDRKNNKSLPETIISNNSPGKDLSYTNDPSDSNRPDQNYKINFINNPLHKESSQAEKPHVPRTSYRSRDLNILNGTCSLYNDFRSGKRLTQKELFGLASNIIRIESGASNFKSILDEKSHYSNEFAPDHWIYYFYYMKDRPVKPCAQFCPHHKTCLHGENILSTLKPEYHKMERVYNSDLPLVGLDEAAEDFATKFAEALDSPKGGWHVIKSQTAIGKTRAIINLLKDKDIKVLVATPTNMLKQEEFTRAHKAWNRIGVSPSLHEVKNDLLEDIWQEIERHHRSGKSTWPLVCQILAKSNPGKVLSKDTKGEHYIEVLRRYMSEELRFKEYPSGITTHMRLPSIDLKKYDVVIVDEDFIFSTIIPNRECISISDLKKLTNALEPLQPLALKIKDILAKKNKDRYFKVKWIEFKSDYDDIELDLNIRALCAAQYFYYQKATDKDSEIAEDSVIFVNPIKFKGVTENTKFIMLSATANKFICECCFGKGNVTFYECQEAAIKGKLNQYYEKSMSRSHISNHMEIMEQIKKITGVKHTITFKKFDAFCTTEMHFGNCLGCDTLNGNDLDIIGTPHQPEWVYKLFAFSLGHKVDEEIKPHTLVTYNGFRFRFTTYNDELLRNIQFYMIESDLEQAVGRARLLRNNCTVNLFSNFPLRQATLMEANLDVEE